MFKVRSNAIKLSTYRINKFIVKVSNHSGQDYRCFHTFIKLLERVFIHLLDFITSYLGEWMRSSFESGKKSVFNDVVKSRLWASWAGGLWSPTGSHASFNKRCFLQYYSVLDHIYMVHLLPLLIIHFPWTMILKFQWTQNLCKFSVAEAKLKEKVKTFLQLLHWGSGQKVKDKTFSSNLVGRKQATSFL